MGDVSVHTCQYALVEAVEPFIVDGYVVAHSHIYYSRCFPRFRDLLNWVMQVCTPCHYAFFETVEPFKLHPKYMSFINKVIEHHLRL